MSYSPLWSKLPSSPEERKELLWSEHTLPTNNAGIVAVSLIDLLRVWVGNKGYRHTASAASASFISTIAGFPLDSVKSRLQVKRYSSVLDCVQRTYHEEGVRGFFRGVWIPLLTITIVRTASFTIYSETKRSFLEKGYFKSDRARDKAALGFCGGATSGMSISFGSCAFELVKVRAQLEYLIASKRGVPYSPSGTLRGAYLIYKESGLKGLYFGFPLHFARDTLGTGFYFSFYDTLRFSTDQYFPESLPLGIPKAFAPFICGSTSGILSWALIYPLDMVKTRVQRDALAGTLPRDSTWQVFRKLSKGGIAKLYRGLGVSAFRSFFTHGLMWFILENVSTRIGAYTGNLEQSS